MNEERVNLLRQLNKLQEERDEARKRGYDHIATARQYRMKLVEKKLKRMKNNELNQE